MADYLSLNHINGTMGCYRRICIKHLATSNRYSPIHPSIHTHQSQSKWHFNNIRAVQSRQQGVFRDGWEWYGMAWYVMSWYGGSVVMERAYFGSNLCG